MDVLMVVLMLLGWGAVIVIKGWLIGLLMKMVF
jgi:hypothetical protein